MGGIQLKAVYRPQFIGQSDKHKLVSLFSQEAKKPEKITPDVSAGDESEIDAP